MSNSTELQIVIEAKDLASKTLSNIGDNMEAGFKKASNAAKIAGAAIVGFGIASVKHFASVGEEVSNMAKKTGLSTESISALRVAADQSGIALGSIETAVKKMQLGMVDAGSASDELKKAFVGMGSNINDIFAKGTTPEIQFEMLGNAIGNVKDPAERTRLAIETFGKAGTDLLPMFEAGNFSMEEASKHAKELGLSFDEARIQTALLADEALDNLQSSMEGVSNSVAASLAPMLTNLITKIQPIIYAVVDWISKNPELTAQLIAVAAGLTGIMAVAPLVVAGVTAIGTIFAFIVSPIGLVVAGIVALIAVITAVIMNWDLLKLKTMEVWNSMTGFLTAVLNTMTIFIKEKMSGIQTGVSDAMSGLSTAWTGFWTDMKTSAENIIAPIITLIENIIGKIQAAIEAIKNFASTSASSGSVKSASALGSSKSGKKARGGSVGAGDSFLVGEEGQEMFTPSVHGSIMPSSRTNQGSSININITGNTLLDSQAAEKMGDLIIGRLRLNHRLA